MNDVPGVGECGEYDLYVLFAMRFKWTPEQVNALTPDFIDELLAYQSAEARRSCARTPSARVSRRKAREDKELDEAQG